MLARNLTKKEVQIIERLVDFVKSKHMRCEGHDYSHVLEVCDFSIKIARKIDEQVDPFVMICGALLHDIGRINAPNGLFHGLDGASRAEELLESLIPDTHTIDKIEKIIVRHTPTSGIPPQSAEEKVIFDADTIERLGFMGMVRGLMGQTGTIQSICENRIAKRLADYGKLFYKESRRIALPYYKETLAVVKSLKECLKKRTEDINEITSYRAIIAQEARHRKKKEVKKKKK